MPSVGSPPPPGRPTWRRALRRRYGAIDLDDASIGELQELIDHLAFGCRESLKGLRPPAIGILTAQEQARRPKASDRRPRRCREVRIANALLDATWRHVGGAGVRTLCRLELRGVCLAMRSGWTRLVHALSPESCVPPHPPGVRALEVLHISDCDLGAASLQLIGVLRTDAPRLRSLELSGCCLPPAAAPALAGLVGTHGRCRSDWLYDSLTRQWGDSLHPVSPSGWVDGPLRSGARSASRPASAPAALPAHTTVPAGLDILIVSRNARLLSTPGAARQLAHALRLDVWLQCVDLRATGASETSLRLLEEAAECRRGSAQLNTGATDVGATEALEASLGLLGDTAGARAAKWQSGNGAARTTRGRATAGRTGHSASGDALMTDTRPTGVPTERPSAPAAVQFGRGAEQPPNRLELLVRGLPPVRQPVARPTSGGGRRGGGSRPMEGAGREARTGHGAGVARRSVRLDKPREHTSTLRPPHQHADTAVTRRPSGAARRGSEDAAHRLKPVIPASPRHHPDPALQREGVVFSASELLQLCGGPTPLLDAIESILVTSHLLLPPVAHQTAPPKN